MTSNNFNPVFVKSFNSVDEFMNSEVVKLFVYVGYRIPLLKSIYYEHKGVQPEVPKDRVKVGDSTIISGEKRSDSGFAGNTIQQKPNEGRKKST